MNHLDNNKNNLLEYKIIQQIKKKLNKRNNKPKLVLLITIDCLRADHVNNDTININKLATDGVVFKNAFSNSSATRGSFPNIFYSKYQWEAYNENNGKLIQNLPSLQRSLKDVGYKTFSIHANPFISRFYEWGSDFDVFDDSIVYNNKEKYKIISFLKWFYSTNYAFKEGSADQIFLKFKDYLDNNLHKSKNLFFHLHFMDPHEPLLPSLKYFKEYNFNLLQKMKAAYYAIKLIKDRNYICKLSPENKNFLIMLYRAEILYVDHIIGEIVNYLKELDLFKDTFIILTADHGQEFGEHDMFVHGRAYDEVVHVPLIFYYPHKLIHTEINQIFQHMDISPTIMDILNISVPENFNGVSRMSNINNRDIIEEGIPDRKIIIQNAIPDSSGNSRIYWAIRDNKYKYIQTLNEKMQVVSEELYDLKRDPKEKTNIGKEKEDISFSFRLFLRENIPKFEKYQKNL